MTDEEQAVRLLHASARRYYPDSTAGSFLAVAAILDGLAFFSGNRSAPYLLGLALLNAAPAFLFIGHFRRLRAARGFWSLLLSTGKVFAGYALAFLLLRCGAPVVLAIGAGATGVFIADTLMSTYLLKRFMDVVRRRAENRAVREGIDPLVALQEEMRGALENAAGADHPGTHIPKPKFLVSACRNRMVPEQAIHSTEDPGGKL